MKGNIHIDKFIPAKWKSRGRKGVAVDVVVIHYTAGRGEAETVANFLKRGGSKVSAHYIIGRDGTLIQSVDLKDAAWHAGKSNFMGSNKSVNRRSVGIELCNAGYSHTDRLDEADKFRGRHRNPRSKSGVWEAYTEEQYKVLYCLLAELQKEIPTLKFVTAHEDIRNPDVVPGLRGSKLDVGPAFDWSVLEAGKDWTDHNLTQVHWNFKTKKWELGEPK